MVRARKREVADERSLSEELKALRAALRQAREEMELGEADTAKIGGLVARLCDSIVRALLAQQRLAARGDAGERLRAEIERILGEMDA